MDLESWILVNTFVYDWYVWFDCMNCVSRMTEAKAVVGLSWEPNIPNFSAITGLKVDAKPQETNHRWKPASQLVDGLFVPPNNPKTLNKLQRKQLKDTTGSNWYVSSLLWFGCCVVLEIVKECSDWVCFVVQVWHACADYDPGVAERSQVAQGMLAAVLFSVISFDCEH